MCSCSKGFYCTLCHVSSKWQVLANTQLCVGNKSLEYANWNVSEQECATFIIWLADSVSGQYESNPGLWLATQAGKMELCCLLLTSRCVTQEKFPRKPYINPLLTKLVPSRWLGIGQLLFLQVYGPQLRLHSLNTQKKNLANIQPSWPNKFGQWQMSCWKTLTIHVWLWRLQQRIKMKSFNAQTTKIFAMKRFRNVHVSLTFELIYKIYITCMRHCIKNLSISASPPSWNDVMLMQNWFKILYRYMYIPLHPFFSASTEITCVENNIS